MEFVNFEDITVGTTTFSVDGVTFAGGIVSTLEDSSLFASEGNSYVFGDHSGTISFANGATEVRFFFVDDPSAGSQFTATAFNLEGNFLGNLRSGEPVTDGSDSDTNFVSFEFDEIGMIELDGGIIDDVSFVPSRTDFTLQVLHASDLEGGIAAIDRATNFAAIADILEDEVNNSITLSSGDNFIPGPFFFASEDESLRGPLQNVYSELFDVPPESLSDLREGLGRLDISIMNIIGFDASAVGNHEFDRGTDVFNSIISTDISDGEEVRWLGAQFPYLSANLDFSEDSNLSGLFTSEIWPNTFFESGPEDLDAAATAPKLAPATIIELEGDRVGVVGLTTPTLPDITAGLGDVEVIGEGQDTAALAPIVQPTIDALEAEGINKIILVTHLQQLPSDRNLLPLLSGVDILVAGGSDILLADSEDNLREGDVPEENYPIVSSNADGDPALIVSTDSQYSYVGRLVVDFDASGKIIPESIDPTVSGAFATTRETVVQLWDDVDPFGDGTKGNLVQQLMDSVEDIINPKDSEIVGLSDVFLEGRRDALRTEETNLGNLTADSMLAAVQSIDDSVAVAIKNGGELRSQIGSIDPNTGVPGPTPANPRSGKKAGEISRLDVENTLRFNNDLVLLSVTAAGLKQVLESAVSQSEPGLTPGRFPQVGGLRFSFDILDERGNPIPEGSRVRSAAIVNPESGQIIDVVVENGEVAGDGTREIRVVTIEFLADGGDEYPFDILGSDRVDTGISEQDAFADYLMANFSEMPFGGAETPKEEDRRIQNLDFRSDTVLSEGVPNNRQVVRGTTQSDVLDAVLDGFNGVDNRVLAGDGDDLIDASTATSIPSGNNLLVGGSGNDTLIAGMGDRLLGGPGDDLLDASVGPGRNRLFGGPGADQFWIANGEIPAAANIIADFTPDEDVLRISGIDFNILRGLTVFQDGNNARIALDGRAIAILQNVNGSTLLPEDFFLA